MVKTLEQTIGMNLTALREARGWNLVEMGKALERPLGQEWSRQAVWLAEKGKRSFAAPDLVGLASALQVTVSDLLKTSETVAVGKSTIDPKTLMALSAGGLDTSYMYRIFLAAAEVKNSMRNQQILYDDLVRVLQHSVADNEDLRDAIKQDLARARSKFEREARAVAEKDGIDVSTKAKFEKYLTDWDWFPPQMKTALDVMEGDTNG